MPIVADSVQITDLLVVDLITDPFRAPYLRIRPLNPRVYFSQRAAVDLTLREFNLVVDLVRRHKP